MKSLLVSLIIIAATAAGTATVSAADDSENTMHSYWIGR